MSSFFQKNGAFVISVMTAMAIIASALFFKGSAYENMWLVILAVGSILAGFVEVYQKKEE